MEAEHRRQEEIETRIAEMRYAVSRLSPDGDPRGRYLRHELEALIAECDQEAERWLGLRADLESLERELPGPRTPPRQTETAREEAVGDDAVGEDEF